MSFDKLTLGRAYRKLFVKPNEKAFFLFVDEKDARPWYDTPVEDGKLAGLFCPWDTMTDEPEGACLGVIVCAKEDLATVVHECVHAANHYCGVLCEKCPDIDNDAVEENSAYATQVLFEQISGVRTWRQIYEDYAKTLKNKIPPWNELDWQ